MAPQATTSDWMYGDVASGILGIQRWAHMNPLRWSGAQPIEKTIQDLENLSETNAQRPIVLKIPAAVFAKERRFDNADAALTYLEHPELTAEWMYEDVADGLIGVQEWAHMNPLRWSGSMFLSEAIEVFKDPKKADQNRPILLKIPAGIWTPVTTLKDAKAACDYCERMRKKHDEAALSWKEEYTSRLCDVGEEDVFRGKVPLLDPEKYYSTLKTIDDLNSNASICPTGICVILSKRLNKYQLIYRSDKRRAALDLFDLADRISWQDFNAKRSSHKGRVGSTLTSWFALIAEVGVYKESRFFDNKKLIMFKTGQVETRYRRIKTLGEGVGGVATLVIRQHTNLMYVLKEPHASEDGANNGNEDLVKEFKKMQVLRHPNCLKILELLRVPTSQGEQAVTITEFAQGGDFNHFLQEVRSHERLTELYILGLLKEALCGVAFLHASDCLHQDLKPDNLLVMQRFDLNNPTQVPRVVLADYGCARFIDKDDATVFGDPRYISPENWRMQIQYLDGDGDVPLEFNRACDVWSMGVTLYEMLSEGSLPFLYEPCSLERFQDEDGVFKRFQDGLLDNTSVKVSPYCGKRSISTTVFVKQMLQKDSTARPTAQAILEDLKKNSSPGGTKAVEFRVQQYVASQLLLNEVMWRLPIDFTSEYWPVFQSIDLDHTGRITFEQFRKMLTDQDPHVVEDIFKKADVDGDGTLEWNEFAVMCFDWSNMKSTELEKYLEEILLDLSSDNTNMVTFKDLDTYFGDAVTAEDLERVFRRMSHSDGPITAPVVREFLLQQRSVAALSISCEVPITGPLKLSTHASPATDRRRS